MKIDTTVKPLPPGRSKDMKTGKSQAMAGAAAATSVSDEVRLTRTSGMLQELETQLAEVDVADAGKVESIRQAIADGRFVVDDEAVAEGLIRESIDNISHHPQE